MADDNNVIPLFTIEPDWAPMIRLMEHDHIPITRENYLAVVYMGSPHDENDLPPFLREDAPKPKRGFLHLSPEKWAETEKNN
jgi:hypothetical protein